MRDSYDIYYKITQLILAAISLVLAFILGFATGVWTNEMHCKKYMGVVIEKEYLPEEIVENGLETERYEAQYNLILKDNAGQRICTSVSKDVFNNAKIGSLLRR